MHEATIARNILSHASARLERMGGQYEAASVRVRIGQFRNVDPESLAFAFDSLKSLFKNCQRCVLELSMVEATAICRDNKHEYGLSACKAFCCPLCGSGIGEMIKGRELDIVDIQAITGDTIRSDQHARPDH